MVPIPAGVIANLDSGQTGAQSLTGVKNQRLGRLCALPSPVLPTRHT
jgi:hypothetical protein